MHQTGGPNLMHFEKHIHQCAQWKSNICITQKPLSHLFAAKSPSPPPAGRTFLCFLFLLITWNYTLFCVWLLRVIHVGAGQYHVVQIRQNVSIWPHCGCCSLGLLWKELSGKFVYKSFCWHLFLLLLDKFLKWKWWVI